MPVSVAERFWPGQVTDWYKVKHNARASVTYSMNVNSHGQELR